MPQVKMNGVTLGRDLFYFGGPCVIESLESTLDHARKLQRIARAAGVPFVFKSSFDKANRMRVDSFRGPGLERGLEILAEVKRSLKIPVVTDVHELSQVDRVAQVVDVLQVPAFLCRQTDLVVECARTGKAVNIKKGQFLSPWDMEHIAKKAGAAGNSNILLTERGTTFGYGYLVNDMRAVPIMKSFGFLVLFDAGHSVQLPGQQGGRSGGMRDMIPVLARAGVAAGADGLYLECHEKPDRALSDGPNMLALRELPDLLAQVKAIRESFKRTDKKRQAR